MGLEYILSEKGKPKLLYKNFIFANEKTVNGVTYWHCDQLKTKIKCKKRVQTKNDAVIKENDSFHHHVVEASYIEAKKIRNTIRKNAKETENTPTSIISSAVAGSSKAAKAHLSTPANLKRCIRKCRKPEEIISEPTSRSAIHLTGKYLITEEGNKFLYYDSGEEVDKRILIFTTEENLELLKSSERWYGDGTFDTAPNLFCQLYTIHGIKDFESIPLLYGLLPSKEFDIYEIFFTQVRELVDDYAPPIFSLDYERAAINAINSVFDESEIRGCFFHFQQCYWRQIQSCGLHKQYTNDTEFAQGVKLLPAIAFVPKQDVRITYLYFKLLFIIVDGLMF